MASLLDLLKRAWRGYPATVVLAALYPTLFVLSQNWYALHTAQAAWLVAVAIAAGLAIYLLVELGLRAASRLAARWRTAPLPDVRPVVFGIVCGVIVSLLLYQTLKAAVQDRYLVIPVYIAIGALFVYGFLRGAQRQMNAFLALLSFIASASWVASAMDTSQSWIASVRQDFEGARFKKRPNVYLFIYDAYTSDDAYRKVFDIDNAAHYAALEKRGFRVLHTFSNYRSTLQTTISVFMGMHHYYSTETGFDDTQKGRPLLAGVIHNPVLEVLKRNGYRLQYIHGLDYFVNEQGILDYMFPEKPVSSALRVFGVPLLKMKRRITIEAQNEVLYSRLHPPAGADGEPWFTFAHVNLPAHADLAADWRTLGGFGARYKRMTAAANTHMLETLDRIRAVDPDAVVIIFGDHGAHRYNRLAAAPDPNAAFAEAGISAEIAALDEFGIMIAIGSAGLCDGYVYDGMTPVNMMRSVFACLAEDRALLDGRAPDITLYRDKKRGLRLAARDGKALPAWETFEPEGAFAAD